MSEEPPYKNTKSTNLKDLSGAVLVKTIFEDVGDYLLTVMKIEHSEPQLSRMIVAIHKKMKMEAVVD